MLQLFVNVEVSLTPKDDVSRLLGAFKASIVRDAAWENPGTGLPKPVGEADCARAHLNVPSGRNRPWYLLRTICEVEKARKLYLILIGSMIFEWSRGAERRICIVTLAKAERQRIFTASFTTSPDKYRLQVRVHG